MKLNEFKKVIKDSGQFNINNRVNEIDVTNFIDESYYQVKKPFPRKMVFSALSLLIILTMGFFVRLSVTPVTTLTIDINPSIEVDLNVFNRVIDIEGTNQAGLEFIEELDYKNKSIDDVIITIYNAGVEEEYFTESEAYMLVGVYSEDFESEEKLGTILDEITDLNILSIFFHTSNDTELSRSLSIGSQEFEDSLYSSVDGLQNDYVAEIPVTSAGVPDVYTDISSLANSYQISETKIVLVIDIFNSSDTYNTNTDFEYLVALDISALIQLYNEIE